jgi:hypothetical protein
MRNSDMIRAVESRLDMERQIIRQVTNLDSMEHGVETRGMQDRDNIWTVRSTEISTID